MRYGIFYLPSLSQADHENASDRLHSIVNQSAYAEELGFDSVWLAEHHFQPEGYECIPNILMLAVHLVHSLQGHTHWVHIASR